MKKSLEQSQLNLFGMAIIQHVLTRIYGLNRSEREEGESF